jgi:hypothetical protein
MYNIVNNVLLKKNWAMLLTLAPPDVSAGFEPADILGGTSIKWQSIAFDLSATRRFFTTYYPRMVFQKPFLLCH